MYTVHLLLTLIMLSNKWIGRLSINKGRHADENVDEYTKYINTYVCEVSELMFIELNLYTISFLYP